MLRLLRKRLPKIRERHLFLVKTLWLSAALHGVIVFGIMLSMQFSEPYRFVVRKEHMHKNTRIVLLPLVRHVSGDPLQAIQQEVTKIAARNDTQQKKAEFSSIIPEKKSSTTLTKQASEKELCESTAKPIIQEKKDEKKIASHKKVPQESDHKKQTTTEKSASKIDKQQQQTLTDQEQLKESKVSQQTKQQQQQANFKKSEQPKVDNKENSIYVGRDDVKELQLYKAVSLAVQQEWQPPAGAPATAVCEIVFVVGPDGIAQDIQVLASSDMLAYDIAARLAVSRARFATTARGKRCTVVFKL